MHVSFVEYTAATVRFSPPVVGLAQMAFANKTGRASTLTSLLLSVRSIIMVSSRAHRRKCVQTCVEL